MDDDLLFALLEANSLNSKSRLVQEASKEIHVPPNVNPQLSEAFQIGRTLESIASEYLMKMPENETSIDEIFSTFYSDNIGELTNKASNPTTNIYTISSCDLFARFNAITRKVSTKLGHIWELVANTSRVVILPEIEFGVKITGVDVITMQEGIPYFTQIKTMEGTLTGSQVPRSREELKIQGNSLFVAAIDTGGRWTFNSPDTPRLRGDEYWRLIGIDYNHMITACTRCLRRFEDNIANL